MVLKLLLPIGCLLALAAPSLAHAGACAGVPDSKPLWADYAGHDAPIRARPGIVMAFTSGTDAPAAARAAGAGTVFFDLHFNDRVGTPTAPADPATIPTRAARLFDFAVSVSGCQTPLIALNELFGAYTTTPWSPGNAQYRANILALVRGLAARGARVFVNVAHPPYTGGEAGDWWRQLAQSGGEIVRQVFYTAPDVPALSRMGPLRASRAMRSALRGLVRPFTALGIPAAKVGLSLQFVSAPGEGGRQGLQPTLAWLEIVKLEAFTAAQVASELHLGSVWSWGWATFSEAGADPDKAAAACVYLWARDPRLCDGPAAAGPGFDASRREGQLELPAGARCTFAEGRIDDAAITRLSRVTRDPTVAATALWERLLATAQAPIDQAEVLAAERDVIVQRFRGVRSLYEDALRRAGADTAIARDVIADELRAREIGQQLAAGAPGDEAVQRFYDEQAALTARRVSADPAPPWLGGVAEGVALGPFAPPQVLTLADGATAVLSAGRGSFHVRALGKVLPLAAFPLEDARPAIEAALERIARDRAYETWAVKAETQSRDGAVCRRDDVPAVAAVDLTAYLPFLALI